MVGLNGCVLSVTLSPGVMAMNRKPKLLDLFCGAGGAAMGYHRAGFEVVGVDIEPQPHYPFEFHQADALTYPLEGFDAYHASPPCQYYSRLRHLPWLRDKIYWRSVPPTRQRLEQLRQPWVIENVEDCWDLENSMILCGRTFGLPIYRHRRFEVHPILIFTPPHQKHTGVVAAGRATIARRYSQNSSSSVGVIREISRNTIAGHIGGVERARLAMDIDWMNQKEITQAIPPAYTEYIGKYLIEYINNL